MKKQLYNIGAHFCLCKNAFKTGLAWLWIAVLVLIVDRLTKAWALAHLVSYYPTPVTPFFDLTLTYNTGAAFSFLNSASGWQNMLFVNLAYAVCLLILYWLYKLPANTRWLSIGLSLIVGGALGNAWDRVLYGYVVDFLAFHLNDWHFAIFNIADSAICVGAFMMFLRWRSLPK